MPRDCKILTLIILKKVRFFIQQGLDKYILYIIIKCKLVASKTRKKSENY